MCSGSAWVTENGFTWSLEAANSIRETVAMLVQRGVSDPSGSSHPHFPGELPASPARRFRPTGLQPSPLYARVARVDSEDHATLDETTRPLVIARRPLRVRSC